MFLTLFIIFLCLSLVLIIVGLVKPEHSELSLAGFMFMFILSMVIILGGDIQYKTGVNETYEYSCLCCSNGQTTTSPGICTAELNNSAKMEVTKVLKIDNYENWNSGIFGHFFGYWLAIVSAVGFIGVLAGLRGGIKQ